VTINTATGLYIDGEWRAGERRFNVNDKFTFEPVAELTEATPSDVLRAIDGAVSASSNPLSPGRRSSILETVADLLEQDAERIVADYVAETGFTYSDARGELARAVRIYRLSAQEALRIAGEQIPITTEDGLPARLAFSIRVPVGVVVAIAPFNAPLSTVAHKVGPAIAAGNAVVLKPAERTPLSAINAVQAFAAAGLPAGFLQLVCGPGRDLGDSLVGDPRVRFYTFTGSTAVGRRISERAGLARTQLELGANSATIVDAGADAAAVVNAVSRAGYRKAGQVCTSVQRLLVHRREFDEVASRLADRVASLVAGDPHDPNTDVGPLIDPAEADRASDWIAEARASSANVVGGEKDRAVLTPTLLIDPPAKALVLTREIFAPVVSLIPVDSVEAAVDLINAGEYGLQAGIFTNDLTRAIHAARTLRVGGVIINDTSSFHADEMPYGGVKESGHGTEGPRYAVHEMTDPRLIVFTT
jgi:acyl-CoA reductase-like NAD-dependent aldehyde dehydrogenase